MAEPILKLSNLTRTHSLKVFPEEIEIHTHYPTQTLRNRLAVGDVEEVTLSTDPTQRDPRYCMVSIKGKRRQLFDIPEMETYQAQRLKTVIDTQLDEIKRTAELDSKKGKKGSSVAASLPLLRRRF